MKIDRSFVVQLSGQDLNLDFVESILSMARALGMDVVAEGVEEGAQVLALKTLGCGFAQGFFFGKPVASEEAELLIANQAEAEKSGVGPASDNSTTEAAVEIKMGRAS